MHRRNAVGATLAVLAVALSGCGGSGSGSDDRAGVPISEVPGAEATGGDDSAGTREVAIVDFAYEPADLEVNVGDTVAFANEDSATHTATSAGAPAPFDTGDLAGGEAAEVTFDDAGAYAYYCAIHDYMKGTVRVLE